MCSQVPSHALESRFFELDYEEVAAQSSQVTEMGRLLTEALGSLTDLSQKIGIPNLIENCYCFLEEISLSQGESSSHWHLPLRSRLSYFYLQPIAVRFSNEKIIACNYHGAIFAENFPVGLPDGFLWKQAIPFSERFSPRAEENRLIFSGQLPLCFVSLCYIPERMEGLEPKAKVCIIIHRVKVNGEEIAPEINQLRKTLINEPCPTPLPSYLFSETFDDCDESWGD
jgi:hypothetical protein